MDVGGAGVRVDATSNMDQIVPDVLHVEQSRLLKVSTHTLIL